MIFNKLHLSRMDNPGKSGVNKQKFTKNLDIALSKKRENCKNNRYITKTKYSTIIKQVKAAKKKRKGKLSSDIQRLKRFDIIKEHRKERLIVPNSDKNIYYVTKDELYDVINDAHLSYNHAGKAILFKHLKEKYRNVTHESIAIYINLCTICNDAKNKTHLKRIEKEVKAVGKQEVNATKDVPCRGMLNEVKPRGCFYFIDMSEEPDGDYKYIIVYEDEITKFVQLKPLKSKEVKEVAGVLLDIFSTFGAPCVLQSGSDEETADGIISRLCSTWTGPPIRHEKICLVEPNNDINKILYCWLCRSSTYKWSDGLRFIQYIRNITYNEVIHKSPFEAMFGRKGKLDVSSLNLPQELIGDIRSEEDPAFPNPNDNMNILEINNMLEIVMDVSD